MSPLCPKRMKDRIFCGYGLCFVLDTEMEIIGNFVKILVLSTIP